MLATELDRGDRAFLVSTIVPIRSWQGESVEAELEESCAILMSLGDPENVAAALAARAHVALTEGRLMEARDDALERGRLSPTNAPSAYSMAARAAVWMGHLDAVRADFAALESTHAHGPAITLHKTTIRAGIAALEGHPGEALSWYGEAIRGWQDAGLPVLGALTSIDMAIVLDPALPEVQAAGATAREILTGLGARRLLERLESASAARAIDSARQPVPTTRTPLADRVT